MNIEQGKSVHPFFTKAGKDSFEHEESRARPKRREKETQTYDATSMLPATAPTTPPTRQSSPRVIIPASSPLPTSALVNGSDAAAGSMVSESTDAALAPKTPPPKKVLRLSANGGFSSPPVRKRKDPDEPKSETPKKRGRKRKSVASSPEKHLLVKLGYGHDEQSRKILGERIGSLLAGEESLELDIPTTPRRTTLKKRTPRRAKATHPFFTGKIEEERPHKREVPRKATAVTPGKLRVKAFPSTAPDDVDTSHFTSALLRDRFMTRHPGAKEAPFPSHDQVHVRGLTHDEFEHNRDRSVIAWPRRKRKQAIFAIAEDESVLTRFATRLEPERDRAIRADGFLEPDMVMTLPEKLLIPGDHIAARVKGDLSLTQTNYNEDELSTQSPQTFHHAALQNLWRKIPGTLTAFDESRGESLQWAQKYAPTCCDDVLQPYGAMATLKTWLSSLAVQTVGGSAPATTPLSRTRPAEKPKKKRKKKDDDLDNFLVDDDEAIHDMSEFVEVEEHGEHGSSDRSLPKSIVQVAYNGSKLSNAVLLSGPHGCGKTAAAYAVAKEMGFRIFEISSSERRSGRDVLEKVGDMTENHLVKHHGTEIAEASDTDGANRIEEAFQKDLDSGRQGKMSSFFQPKKQTRVKAAEPKEAIKQKTVEAVQEAVKRRPKDQQQSLILLEEVDVLFKDDKEFWTTVLKLITTSKRPFIMTCNDEDLVPIQAMSLYAILRLSQPDVELAADYMVMLAAAEGHLLSRPAVVALYQKHRHDLRASLTELNYWCQMGIGDPRGGLSWIYQRWPPDSDVDQQGRKLRVVSDGTYYESMGMVHSPGDEDETSLVWQWDEFGIGPLDAMGWRNMSVSRTAASPIDDVQRRRDLWGYSRFADSLSAMDAICASAEPTHSWLDVTQPKLPNRARAHYIEGMALLQTDETFNNWSRQMVATITRLLWRISPFARPLTKILPTDGGPLYAQRDLEFHLKRRAFSCFDAICVPSEPTAFDGPLTAIAIDLAPYIRSIVQYDQSLEQERDRLDLLLADGRKAAKRARTTRAARSALEGGQRATTRRANWFSTDLDVGAVLATGGSTWPRSSTDVPIPGSATASTTTEVHAQTETDHPATSHR